MASTRSKSARLQAGATRDAATRDGTGPSAFNLPATDNPFKTFADSARATAETQWQDAASLLTDSMEKASTTMMNNLNDYTSVYRDMTNASLQYCQTWAKGCEELGRSYVGLWQSVSQDCMAAFKSVVSARNVQDAVSAQSDFLRQQCEKIMTETSRMGEVYAKTASEAAEPVQSQWSTMTSRYTPAGFPNGTTDSRAA